MPEALVSLIEQGAVDDVVRPLMSGKEAHVYLVIAHGEQHVAKIYKEANDRTFRQRSEYTEGRRVRNTRDQRAMSKRSRFGRAQQEAAWRAAEVDVIYRLREAGVCVPEPKTYIDGVLVMELVTDRQGNPAPRLADVTLDEKQGEEMFDGLIREVVKMLCAGLVHGDLSEFNILVGSRGAVIIDFPQAVDSATNQNARKLLLRDVGNLVRFFARHRHSLRSLRYGEEIWDLYERGKLKPDSPLTGRFQRQEMKTEVSSLLAEMEEIDRENRARRESLGLPPSRPARQPRPILEESRTAETSQGGRAQRSQGERSGGERPAMQSRSRRRRPTHRSGVSPSANTRDAKPRQGRGDTPERNRGATNQNHGTNRTESPSSAPPRRRRRSRRRPGGGNSPAR